MELKRKKLPVSAGIVGLAGSTAVACVACCVSFPLLAPVLAWLGVAGLGAVASGWYLAMAFAFVLGVVAILLWHRQGRRACARNARTCACNPHCKT